MDIDIKVNAEQTELNPNQLQRLRRTINVLCDLDFSVNLSFKNGDSHNNHDENGAPYMGGTYEHKGYYIRLRRDDIPMVESHKGG